jgi:4-nitrophenyl phosphatase
MTINLGSIQAAVLDLDGVLWRGPQVLPGVAEFFAFLRQQGIGYALATNNSTKTVQSYQERLAGIGVPTTPEQVITSAVATTEHVRRHYPPGTPVYVIGDVGIRQALAEAGFREDPAEARLVVVGLDFGLTYDMLKTATLRIRAGADFIGTNGDLTFPLPDGIVPGNGSVLAALQAATGVKPLVIGKPEVAMFEVALARLGVEAGQAVMIGDRLETDILGAQRAGLQTILVLSGVVSEEQARESEIQADTVYEDVADLHRAWVQALAKTP